MRIENAPNTKFDDILDRAGQILRRGETGACSLPCLRTASMCLLLAISEHEELLPHDRVPWRSTMHEFNIAMALLKKSLAIEPWPAPATLPFVVISTVSYI